MLWHKTKQENEHNHEDLICVVTLDKFYGENSV